MSGYKGCIRTVQWPMKERNEKGERDFNVLCDLVTSARDLYLCVEGHVSVYYIFEALC